MRPQIDVQKEKLEKLYYQQRMTFPEVAEALGISRYTVIRRMKKYNLPARKNSRYKLKIKMPKKKTTLAYIAGLFDGEGTVDLYPRKDSRGGKVPYIGLGMTDKEVIYWLAKTIGGGVTMFQTYEKYKTCYKWRLQGVFDILSFLNAILPYLKVKKKNAEKVIQFLEWKKRTEVKGVEV